MLGLMSNRGERQHINDAPYIVLFTQFVLLSCFTFVTVSYFHIVNNTVTKHTLQMKQRNETSTPSKTNKKVHVHLAHV